MRFLKDQNLTNNLRILAPREHNFARDQIESIDCVLINCFSLLNVHICQQIKRAEDVFDNYLLKSILIFFKVFVYLSSQVTLCRWKM